MELKDLKQYQFLKSEINDLNRRIKKLKAESITQDVVSASCGPPSYAKTSITISGTEIKSDYKRKKYKNF